ncbi:MAG: tRNA (adenosine(37)-N6)-threonylcarbamoyltransferase complex transferase subunit TsaD [Patescibacteria group bacterium]|nr:tRNA (adenosine(37)-N6)-threonylcarbamoyltransferase complex transferase subunit TsaD [Patescibacteria group bacterium]
MKILAIETSCDDTSVSLVNIAKGRVTVLLEVVSSQVNIHAKYGGVVPEVAARKHIENIGPILKAVLAKHPSRSIDRIAVTTGPGLITSLLIGVETAKTLAYAWDKPIVGINHLEGHILSCLIDSGKPRFPAIALVVSGGHTLLVLVTRIGKYSIIGQTQDDAAGEAFDKVARLLKLGYPGGPIIEKLARKGNPTAFDLPRPMLEQKNFDFSFAGLKTAVLYLYRDGKIPRGKINDLCASFQQATVDVLVSKTIKAARKYSAKSVLLSGGVAANQLLRSALSRQVKNGLGRPFHVPKAKHSTDNATMVAVAGYYHKPIHWSKIRANPNLELK